MIKAMMECFDPHLLLEITKKDELKKYTNIDKKSVKDYQKYSVDKSILEKVKLNTCSKEEEESVYTLALYEYSIGAYHEAVDKFYFIRKSTNSKIRKNSCWGKLSCEILLKNFKTAEKDLEELVCEIENEKDQEIALKDRVVLCHWVLFFPVKLQLELFFKPAYMNAIQLLAPWLLKYVVVAVIVTTRNIKEMAKVLASENTTSEVILQFFESIYSKSCIEILKASDNLKALKKDTDYFLQSNRDQLLENCQAIILEVLLKTHSKIGLEKLANLIHLEKDKVKIWVQEYQKNHPIEFDGKYVSMKRKKNLTIADAIDRLDQFREKGLVNQSVELDDCLVGPKYAII
jgi:translation initiation factor 3 subunit E